MPLDALCLTAVAAELRAAVAGGKIDKLYQPTRDEVVLYVRGQGENVRLLLSANPGHPRANLTTLNRENPEQPPMFCMLLRKHLQGARILELNQPPLERILEFRLETLDELGDRVERRLVLEAMGRSANLLLLDGEGRIIDCIRRVDGDLGRGQRQLLPGLFYRQPPAPDKLNPFTIEPEELRLVLENPLGKEWDKLLLDSFTGLSPLVARELAFRAGGDRERLAAELEKLKNNVNENGLTPYLLVREGKPVDFTVLPILQYGPETESRPQASFSQMLDEFYERREAADRVRQRGQDLVKAVTSARDRTARKLANQTRELEATRDRERLRELGDILTSNLHAMERGMEVLRAVDFYDPEGREVEIRLDPLLVPQQNAAKYYKDYNKAKTAEQMLTIQLEKGTGAGVPEQRPGKPVPGGGGAGSPGDPPGAGGDRLPPPGQDGGEAAEKGERKAHGVPLLCRTAHLGGQEQQPERSAHHQAGLQERYLAPHPEDPRLPRDPLAGGGRGRRPKPYRGGHSGGHLLPGGRGKPGAGGLYAGKVRQEAGRRPAGHGGLYDLPDRRSGPGPGAGQTTEGEIEWISATFWWSRMTPISTSCSAASWRGRAMPAARPFRAARPPCGPDNTSTIWCCWI